MTKTALRFNGKENTFIEVQLCHKPLKGQYEKDIIRATMKSRSCTLSFVCTTEEAVILACGLTHAVMMKDIDNSKKQQKG